jgi:hypothetical protein
LPALPINLDSRTRPRALLADGCYLVGGGALLASTFLHWVARGPGSAARGHKLVDEIVALGKHLPALSAGRLTVVWYLVPAFGAIGWIVLGLQGAHSRAARIVAILAVAMATLAFIAFEQLVGLDRLGWGPWVALLGAGLMCAASWLPPSMRQNDAAGL